jgi:acyl-CoA synthetase (AMP-forming)/AMP-acid ligase II
LREHCTGTLAGYKVPARIEFVTEVARFPSGKADYRWARAVLRGQDPVPNEKAQTLQIADEAART